MTSRRALQLVVAVLALVPLTTSSLIIIQGAGRFIGTEAVPAGLDSAIRYLAGVYFGVALYIWWIIPRIERQSAGITFVAGAIFLGGVSRAVSVADVGTAGLITWVFLTIELMVPLLVVWQRRLAQDAVSLGA